MGKMNSMATAQETGAKAVAALGVSSIAELRAKPLAELTGLNSAGLVIDGYLIPEDLSLTFMNGKQQEWAPPSLESDHDSTPPSLAQIAIESSAP